MTPDANQPQLQFISLRDTLAAAALPQLIDTFLCNAGAEDFTDEAHNASLLPTPENRQRIANAAYAMADAMLVAREQSQSGLLNLVAAEPAKQPTF